MNTIAAAKPIRKKPQSSREAITFSKMAKPTKRIIPPATDSAFINHVGIAEVICVPKAAPPKKNSVTITPKKRPRAAIAP